MARFGPTGKASKKLVHLLRWSSFPGRTGLNFGWMDRAHICLICLRTLTSIRGLRTAMRDQSDWRERIHVVRASARPNYYRKGVYYYYYYHYHYHYHYLYQNSTPIWRLDTKFSKNAWNVSASNSEIVGHKDPRLGQIVYILVFYNISFSWLLPLDGFQFIFLLRDSENDL